MITKTTAANFDEFYAPRFAEINAALRANGYTGEDITSIDSYFENLTAIGMLPTSQGKAGKYLVVPFDEPYFEINANTRLITVPDHFKKYGVGVSGDNRAEMLVFKIDRYFDHQDLYETNIAINWSFTPKGTRTPIVGTPQAAFAPDDELEPGYVVFGFNVMREMAQDLEGNLTSGTLNFAISFYENDGNEETRYSWNSIPASVTINEGLELKDPNEVKDISRHILARLKDSAHTPEGIIPLTTPVWQTGDAIVDPVSGDNMYLGLPSHANFDIYADGTEADELILTAKAYSDAAATMKYTWFMGFDENSILEARPMDSYAESTDFMETEDDAPVEGKTYYINVAEIVGDEAREAAFADINKVILQIENGVAFITNDNQVNARHIYYEHADGLDNLVMVTDSTSLTALFADSFPEYEYGTSFAVKQAGTYSVRAQAQKEYHEASGTMPAEEEEDDGSTLKIKVSKLTTIPNDSNRAACQANQNAINILQENHNVVITGKLENLTSYPSSNPAQGSKKWIGLDLKTNTSDITSLTWNGGALTADDVAEAASVDLGAGHIVFWVGAETIENAPREIRIGKVGGEAVILKVSFADSALTSVLKTLIDENAANNIQQDNVFSVKSTAIDSNICTVPVAATPKVELSVQTTLEDDYSIIDPSQAEGLTFISPDSPPKIIATVTSTNDEELGAIALEAIDADNINELTAEEIINNTQSEANPEGKYKFERVDTEREDLEPGQMIVGSSDIIAEGVYQVRAINRRNHSYAVSAPSERIETSFVAPAINSVTVTTIDGSHEVVLVDNGLAPVDPSNPNERKVAQIKLNSQYPTRTFTITDNSDNLPGAQAAYVMEEVIETEDHTYIPMTVEHDQGDTTLSYNIVDNKCIIDDKGLYRVRIENVYKGTLRVAYTEVFEVAAI